MHILLRVKEHSLTELSYPMSMTNDVCRPVAKELRTAFFARNNAGGMNFSNISSTTFSRCCLGWKDGSASMMGCSLGFTCSRSLHVLRQSLSGLNKTALKNADQIQQEAMGST